MQCCQIYYFQEIQYKNIEKRNFESEIYDEIVKKSSQTCVKATKSVVTDFFLSFWAPVTKSREGTKRRNVEELDKKLLRDAEAR